MRLSRIPAVSPEPPPSRSPPPAWSRWHRPRPPPRPASRRSPASAPTPATSPCTSTSRPRCRPAPAVVVAMHGCTQTASGVLHQLRLAEVRRPARLRRRLPRAEDRQQQQPLLQLVRARGHPARARARRCRSSRWSTGRVSTYGADRARVYVTGLSAGGAMTSVMLAAYPDVFAGGSVVAGLPYGCATDVAPAFTCMNPGVDRTPGAVGAGGPRRDPGYGGPWPRVAIWHGTSDTTVAPMNADRVRATSGSACTACPPPRRRPARCPDRPRGRRTAAGRSRSTGCRAWPTAPRWTRAAATRSAGRPRRTSSTSSARPTTRPRSGA